MLRQAPTIGDSLCDACREHFAEVRRYLDAFGVRYELVPTLVRGLDYYTRTTWEFVGPEGGSTSTLSGGGRYDGLAEELGGPHTPGVGFGAGIERLLLALEDAARRRPRRRASTSSSSVPRGRRPRGRAREDARAAGRGPARRRGLRRPLGEGPAHAGGAARREARRRGRGRDGSLRGDARELARPPLRRGPARARRPEADARRLGRHAARPRRPRLHRPPRPHRRLPARDQPRARARGSAAAHEVRNEFVLRAEGEVVARAPDAVNPNLPTGAVELQVDTLEIVSRSTPLPFQLDEENVDETLRLRYRWLDLRRDRLQRNIRLRAQMVGVIRRDDGGGRLPRHPDADPLQADARGRARLRRPQPPPEGPLLRAAAVAADPQAAADDRRASTATTRSRSASGTRISAPTASRRSRSSTSRWRSPTSSSSSS